MIESLAINLIGEPSKRDTRKHELRYGSHGSLKIDLKRGRFSDFENDVHGDALDLIKRFRNYSTSEAI